MEGEAAEIRASLADRLDAVRAEAAETIETLLAQNEARTKSSVAEISERTRGAIESLRAEVTEARRSATLQNGMAEALSRLRELLDTPDYHAFLKRQVLSAAELLDEGRTGAEILCRPVDQPVIGPLAAGAGFEVRPCQPGDLPVSLELGGFLVKLGGRLLDCSVRGRYERCISVQGPDLGHLAQGDQAPPQAGKDSGTR